jgi:hypothetical protein
LKAFGVTDRPAQRHEELIAREGYRHKLGVPAFKRGARERRSSQRRTAVALRQFNGENRQGLGVRKQRLEAAIMCIAARILGF